MRYRGAWSHGKASVIWREIHSAVGFAVTPNGALVSERTGRFVDHFTRLEDFQKASLRFTVP
jgi:hypothetical protein